METFTGAGAITVVGASNRRWSSVDPGVRP
jgi:hypothetical protein